MNTEEKRLSLVEETTMGLIMEYKGDDDRIDPEILAKQADLYAALTRDKKLRPGSYTLPQTVWIMDRPYLWQKNISNGQLSLIPDKFTRAMPFYRAALHISSTVVCPKCGEGV